MRLRTIREPGQSFLGSGSFLSNHFIASKSSSSSRLRLLPLSGPHPYTIFIFNNNNSVCNISNSRNRNSLISLSMLTCTRSLGRPNTAILRPGTAPASASFFSSKPFTGLASSSSSRPDLSTLHSGQFWSVKLGYSRRPPNVTTAHDSSFFYFHPPSDPNSSNSSVSYHQHQLLQPANNSNPCKRAFAGPDGPHDESPYTLRGGEHPSSSSGYGAP
jgi:hypothetical protein